jgi:hypothetical protein
MNNLDEIEQVLAYFGFVEKLFVGVLLSLLAVILIRSCTIPWLDVTIAILGGLVIPVATLWYIDSCSSKWRDW